VDLRDLRCNINLRLHHPSGLPFPPSPFSTTGTPRSSQLRMANEGEARAGKLEFFEWGPLTPRLDPGLSLHVL
jgi:hypothetical protein